MKAIVRSFVVAIAVTGFLASSYAKAPSATATVNVTKTSAMPVPTCPPGVPNGCGIFGNK